MTTFKLNVVDPQKAVELRARARSKLFFALRKAAKARGVGADILGKDIADALGKDRAFVSRVLNGTNQSMDFETLVSFLEVLGHNVDLNVRSFEELASLKSNVDARPHASIALPRASNAPGLDKSMTRVTSSSSSIANPGAYHAK